MSPLVILITPGSTESVTENVTGNVYVIQTSVAK